MWKGEGGCTRRVEWEVIIAEWQVWKVCSARPTVVGEVRKPEVVSKI